MKSGEEVIREVEKSIRRQHKIMKSALRTASCVNIDKLTLEEQGEYINLLGKLKRFILITSEESIKKIENHCRSNPKTFSDPVVLEDFLANADALREVEDLFREEELQIAADIMANLGNRKHG